VFEITLEIDAESVIIMFAVNLPVPHDPCCWKVNEFDAGEPGINILVTRPIELYTRKLYV
jgi:hypothetical protein